MSGYVNLKCICCWCVQSKLGLQYRQVGLYGQKWVYSVGKVGAGMHSGSAA